MDEKVKYCAICGAELGDMESMGYYAFIRRKYCPECAAMVAKAQVINCKRRTRRRERETRDLYQEMFEVFRRELDYSRKRIAELEQQRNQE